MKPIKIKCSKEMKELIKPFMNGLGDFFDAQDSFPKWCESVECDNCCGDCIIEWEE